MTCSPLPAGPFECFVADPPWHYLCRSKKGYAGRPQHYRRMSLEEIAALPVREISAPHAHLFLWITGPEFVRGSHLPIMSAWGFQPSAIAFTWIKLNPSQHSALFMTDSSFHMGQGYTTRKNAEFVVLGRRGKPRRHANDIRELIIAARREHSRKPDQFYERVERYVGPVRKLEMFSRTQRPGWDAWGDEVGKWRTAA